MRSRESEYFRVLVLLGFGGVFDRALGEIFGMAGFLLLVIDQSYGYSSSVARFFLETCLAVTTA